VRRGDKVGLLRIRVDGRTVVTFPLYAGETVEATEDMWSRAFDTVKFWVFGG